MSDEAICMMRERLEDLQSENRFMKSELTDAQTNLALLRSELAQLRQQHEDKVRELSRCVLLSFAILATVQSMGGRERGEGGIPPIGNR